jgi:rhomboid protease GluP
METNSRRAILCPNCRRLINPDEARCPYCGIASPGGLRWSGARLFNFSDPAQIIRLIIYTNATLFALSLLTNTRWDNLSFDPFRLLAPDSRALVLLGATGRVPIDQFGRWWTVFTAGYLHGGILHILFNMMALRQIGPLIIQEFGPSRMFLIYTLGGAMGFIASYLAGTGVTIGASSSVCSLIGAALYYGKSRGGHFGQTVYREVSGWVIGLFVFGLLMPGIDNWAHGGGIVGGIVLGLVLGYSERKMEAPYHRILAAICLLWVAGTILWAAASGLYLRFFHLLS